MRLTAAIITTNKRTLMKVTDGAHSLETWQQTNFLAVLCFGSLPLKHLKMKSLTCEVTKSDSCFQFASLTNLLQLFGRGFLPVTKTKTLWRFFCLLQMYVHHGIHDLIFNFVGTLEAGQVGVTSRRSATLTEVCA